MANRHFLTDEQWAFLAFLMPLPKRRADGRDRPVEHDDRATMVGVLWILPTDAAWADLPDQYPSYATCFRRFSQWAKHGMLRRLPETLAQDLEARGDIELSGCFIGGTFIVAKKGGLKSEDQARQRHERMANANAAGLPLAVHTASANGTLLNAEIKVNAAAGDQEFKQRGGFGWRGLVRAGLPAAHEPVQRGKPCPNCAQQARPATSHPSSGRLFFYAQVV
jgi:transposase